ncbi:MAG TPA: hypothetical protein ENJ82_05145, partial [Bacteroidetes bacterium]|nr:hypothetical protein [Bacteroidota bacterium]
MKRVFSKLITAVWVCFSVSFSFAQDADVPLQHEVYPYIDRLDIKGLTGESVSTDYKPYSRRAVSEIFSKSNTKKFSARDRAWFDLTRLAADDDFVDKTQGKGVLKKLYQNRRDFFRVKNDNFRIYMNPIGILGAGVDQHNYTPGLVQESLLNYRNSRGVRVRGTAFKRLGFFTEVTENQWKAPVFMRNAHTQSGVLAGENFVKIF